MPVIPDERSTVQLETNIFRLPTNFSCSCVQFFLFFSSFVTTVLGKTVIDETGRAYKVKVGRIEKAKVVWTENVKAGRTEKVGFSEGTERVCGSSSTCDGKIGTLDSFNIIPVSLLFSVMTSPSPI